MTWEWVILIIAGFFALTWVSVFLLIYLSFKEANK